MRREELLDSLQVGDLDPYSLPATQLQANRILGPCTAGWMASIWLYGVYVVLAGQHLVSPYYGRLSWRVKAILAAVFAFLLLYMICIFADQALWTVTTDRSLFHHYNGYWIDAMPPIFGGIVAALVQSLLLTRAVTMIRQRYVQYVFIGIASLFILFTLASALLTAAATFLYRSGNLERLDPVTLHTARAMWLWASAVTDLIISLSLAATLKKRIAGFSVTTDTLLKKLILAALQTASYTTLLAIVGAATSVAFSDWDRYAALNYAFFTPLFPCYGISLYTTLATRRTVDKYIGSSRPSEQQQTAHLSLRPQMSGTGAPLAPRRTRAEPSPSRLGRADEGDEGWPGMGEKRAAGRDEYSMREEVGVGV